MSRGMLNTATLTHKRTSARGARDGEDTSAHARMSNVFEDEDGSQQQLTISSCSVFFGAGVERYDPRPVAQDNNHN